MKHLLITGFEPFGGEAVNPSWEAVRRLPDTLGDWTLTRLRVPTVFGLAAETVLGAADPMPDAILCVGQAGGRAGLTPEVIGVNLRDARIPDNAGNRPEAEPIAPGGPDGLFATVPVRAMARAMEAAGIPARLSLSAGSFVCNDLLYSLLLHFRGTPVRVGFVHVPYLPEQAKNGEPSLPLEEIVRGLRLCVGALDGEK